MLLEKEHFYEIFEPWRNKHIGLVTLPGNFGDEMILVGCLNLFKEFDVKVSLNQTSNVDEIAILGGGNVGSLWPECREIRQHIIKTSSIPITILPSSISDYEDLSGTRVFIRDIYSLRYWPEAILSHDMALCYKNTKKVESKRKNGVFLRDDKESVFGKPHQDPIHMANSLDEYIELAGSCDNIITDRLHFAIASLHHGRNVTLLQNSYHKNLGVWERSLQYFGCKFSKELPKGIAQRPIQTLSLWQAYCSL